MEPAPPAADGTLPADINLFVLANGRFPRIGDSIAPWHYRGWLLYHVQLADFHPDMPGRWRHLLHILEAGHLLDEPVPRIEFVHSQLDAGQKMLERCIRLIQQQDYSWTALQQLVDWLAWGLAVSSRMPPLREETHEALYRTFDLEPLLRHPHDYLGAMLAERHAGGWNPNAFYPTPHHIVEFMVRLTLEEQGCDAETGRDKRLSTVMDPCVGTGRMLLHASNYSYCLYGIDKDALVAMITRINGALYAPWLSFPLPEEIVGVPIPPPPPAELPLPEENRPGVDVPVFRVDDRGQGLLF